MSFNLFTKIIDGSNQQETLRSTRFQIIQALKQSIDSVAETLETTTKMKKEKQGKRPNTWLHHPDCLERSQLPANPCANVGSPHVELPATKNGGWRQGRKAECPTS